MPDKTKAAPMDTVATKKRMGGLNSRIKQALSGGNGMARKPFVKNTNDWMAANDSLNKARGIK